MKKILMIGATPFFSDRGCHIRIYNEIKYLNKNNVDVELVTYHLGNTPADLDKSKIHRTITIPWYNKITPGASIHKIYIDFFLLIKSIKHYFKYKPDVVYAHLYEALVAAVIIKAISFGKAKIYLDCQGSLAQEMYAYTLHKKKIYKYFLPIFVWIEKFLLMFPQKIFCSSINSYEFLIKKYNISKDKIFLLEDGLDRELFANISDEERLNVRAELGIPKSNKVVVYSGSMAKAKGVDGLLDSVRSILSKVENVTFLFLGYGDLVEKYQAELKDLIDQKKVIIYGRIGYFDIPRFLKAADFAIDPKHDSSEASGKLFNYLDAGLGVICFKNDFNYSVLKDSGMYISSFDDIVLCLKNGSMSEKKIEVPESLSWGEIIKKLIREI